MIKYKIAIVDDELLFVAGIKLLLEQQPNIEVCLTASNGQEFLDLIETKDLEIDIVLLDLSMPILDGIDTLYKLNEQSFHGKVIILTSHYNEGMIIKLLDEGVSGFLSKSVNPEEVIKTVQQVAQRGFYIDDYIMQIIRDRRLLSRKRKFKEKLSKREIEVLKLICKQMTNKEISEQLYISNRTVDGHRNRIMEKTNSKNTAGMVIYAIENRLCEVNISKYQ